VTLAAPGAATPAHVLVYAVAFAMVGISTGLGLEGGASALTIVTLRMVGVVALFLAWYRFTGVSLALPPRERRIAIAIGVVMCFNNWAINESLARIPVPLAILIFYLWPALSAIAMWLLGRERFSGRILVGTLLAFVGVALTLNVEFTSAQTAGVLLALASAVAWTATFVMAGIAFRGRDSRPVTFTMTITAAVILVGVLLITGDWRLPQTARGWTGLATVSFFYAFGMIGMFVASTTLGPVRTGFYMNFEPIATVLLAALILGQTLAPVQLAGAALVIAALFIFRPLKPSG